MTRHIAILAVALFLLSRGATASTPPLTPADKRQVVESVATLMEAMFFEPKRATEIAAELRKRAAAGFFDGASHPIELADALTAAMQQIENDGHLRVRFDAARAHEPLMTTDEVRAYASTRSPGPQRIMRQTPDGGGTPGQAQRRLIGPGGPVDEAQMARDNYAIRTVQHLDGNIGLIRLDSFMPPHLAGDTFSSAMRFLQNVDAMIIDLRENKGGSQQMVAYVASYFFPAGEKTLIMSRFRGAEPRPSLTVEVPGKRMQDVPLYILTSRKTFSAGEAFAYILQQFGRATVVGEKTPGGGRHNAYVDIGGGLQASISISDVVHPKTNSSWQGVGVIPDVAVLAEQALETAQRIARERKPQPKTSTL